MLKPPMFSLPLPPFADAASGKGETQKLVRTGEKTTDGASWFSEVMQGCFYAPSQTITVFEEGNK